MKQRMVRIRAVLVGLLCLFLAVQYARLWSHQLRLKTMRAGFSVYEREHDGRMPPSLKDLVLHARMDPQARDAQAWMGYAYVANLRTNDPPDTPVLITSRRQRGLLFGAMLTLRGHIRWQSNRMLERLVAAPWLLIQDDFEHEADLEEFKQRVKVILPER